MEAAMKEPTDGIDLRTGEEESVSIAKNALEVDAKSTSSLTETFEVSPRDGGWQVRRKSDASTVSIHSTIQGATEHAKSLAYEHRGEFVVRGPDGKMITRDRLGRYSSQPPASTVNMFEARNSLMRLLERAEAGETILITRGGVAVAKLGPCTLPGAQGAGETESQPG